MQEGKRTSPTAQWTIATTAIAVHTTRTTISSRGRDPKPPATATARQAIHTHTHTHSRPPPAAHCAAQQQQQQTISTRQRWAPLCGAVCGCAVLCTARFVPRLRSAGVCVCARPARESAAVALFRSSRCRVARRDARESVRVCGCGCPLLLARPPPGHPRRDAKSSVALLQSRARPGVSRRRAQAVAVAVAILGRRDAKSGGTCSAPRCSCGVTSAPSPLLSLPRLPLCSSTSRLAAATARARRPVTLGSSG